MQLRVHHLIRCPFGVTVEVLHVCKRYQRCVGLAFSEATGLDACEELGVDLVTEGVGEDGWVVSLIDCSELCLGHGEVRCLLVKIVQKFGV